MSLPAHMTIKGTTQSVIEGGCDMEGERHGTILVHAFEHGVKTPRETSTGMLTGKRIHGPVKIVKEFDKASPLIFTAMVNNEELEEVVITWYRPSATGEEEKYYKHTLRKAFISETKAYMPMQFLKENEPYRHMEEVQIVYQEIELEYVDGGITGSDTWKEN